MELRRCDKCNVESDDLRTFSKYRTNGYWSDITFELCNKCNKSFTKKLKEWLEE